MSVFTLPIFCIEIHESKKKKKKKTTVDPDQTRRKNWVCTVEYIFPNTGPEVIKKLCLTQLSMKFFLFVNVKMPTIVGISTFRSMKNGFLGLSVPEKC